EDGGGGAVAEVVDLGEDLDALAVARIATGGEGDEGEVVGGAAGAGDLTGWLFGHVRWSMSGGARGEGGGGRVVDGAVGEDEDPRAGLASEGGASEGEGAAEVGLTR